MFPEIKLGIIVFTNQQVGAAFSAISATIKDSYIGVTGYDWVKILHDRVIANETNANKMSNEVAKNIEEKIKATLGHYDMAPFLGAYIDEWFGEINITTKEGKTWFQSKRSPRLIGEVFPYNNNTLIVKWNDRSLDADAFLIFNTDAAGKPLGLKMKAISPLTDFSFDFQDLDLKKYK